MSLTRCAACGASLTPDVRFCSACGTAVESRPAARSGDERKLVTVLFADVTGSTSLGERLDPERLRDVLATYFDAMRAEIEAEGGTVEKFIGDAIMAVFGVPQGHEDDPARALRAGRRMLGRLDAVNDELRRIHDVALDIRVGVHTGDVLAATDIVPGDPMVTGDVVNTAARLQTAAQPGQMVASARTVRSAPGSRWTAMPALELKGKTESVEAVIVLSGPERPARGIAGLSAPLVGRDGEMNLLRSAFERTRTEGHPHLITIYGEPGVGKSRLVREFLDVVSDDGVTVVQGRCLPYGDGIAYWPLAEILKARSGIDDRDPPAVVIGKIRSEAGIAGATGVDIDRTCEALAFTIGVEDPAGTIGQRDPRQVRSEIHAAWQTFFSALAAERPLIAVVEDIHWADPSLLDILEGIADRADGPMLVLCPTRPNLADRRPTWGGGRRNASSIALDPLTQEQAGELMTLLLDVDDLPDQTRSLILARAEGNPFFLEEIVRHLIDEGVIERAAGRWRTSGSSLAGVAIPDTVQGVLTARIDLLERDERHALEYAAVVGRVFWQPPVVRLLNSSGDRLAEMLARLQDRDLVRSRLGSAIRGETEFIFKHVLTRDVAYERLPRADRARAHAAVAEWIEATAAGRADFDELLCYHFEAAYRAAREDPRADPISLAGMRSRAFGALLTAAREARTRFSIDGAVKLIERAGALSDDTLERVQVLEERGRIAMITYDGDVAWRSFSEAAEVRLSSLAGDRRAIARVCARAIESPTRWTGSMSTIPDESDVERLLRIGLEQAGTQDSVTLVRLLTGQAMIPFAYVPVRGIIEGEAAASRAVALRAAEMAERLDRPDLVSGALDAASSSSIILGRYGDDISLVDRRLALIDRIEDAWETGDTYSMAAWTYSVVGDYQRGWDFAVAGRRRMEGTDAEHLLAHALSWQAYAGLSLGRWDEVIDEVFPIAEELLGERGNDPPYFTQSLYGAVTVIADARRNGPLFDRLIVRLDRLVAGRGGTGANSAIAAAAWRAWVAVRRRDLDAADRAIERSISVPARGHWPLLLTVRALRLAEPDRHDEVEAFLAEMRPWARQAGIAPLGPAFDRLEGRVRLAEGDPEAGIELLASAVRGFDGLGARWEAACARLDLARALASAGNLDRAQETLTASITPLQAIGSRDELEAAVELRAAVRSG